MKKIKYLLWLFIFWLLINHCFWIDVEILSTQFHSWVWAQSDYGNFNYSKSYSYLYKFDGLSVYWLSCLWNTQYTNNSVVYSQSCWQAGGYDFWFNNSIYYFNYYTWWLTDWSYTINISAGQNNTPKVLFWLDDNFWKNVIYTDCLAGWTWCWGYSPKYFLWGPFYFTWFDYLQIPLSDIWNSFRVFFNSTDWSNNIDDVNLVAPNYWPSSFWWEYFTNTQTRTNFWYIVDSNWYKWKHFGSFGLWYSFIYNKNSLNSNFKISWNDLGFSTIYDDILVNLRSFGWLDILNNWGSNSSTDWILVFKKNQYSSSTSNWVIAISKNPNNPSQLLYQEFSCSTNNFNCLAKWLSSWSNWLYNYCPQYIISWGDSAHNPCMPLSQWLLAVNWSTDVLPFTGFNNLYNISDSSLLSYLFNTSNSMLWGFYVRWNQFCFSDTPTVNWLCFDKVPTSDSIKDNYLNWINPGQASTDVINQNLAYLCLNSSNTAFTTSPYCNFIRQQLNNPVAIGSWYYYYIVPNSSWWYTMQIIDQAWLFSGDFMGTWTVWLQDWSWNWVTNCDWGWCNPNPYNTSWSVYLTWDWTNWYYLGSWYYDIKNNITWFFFKCPYPYEHLFTLWGWDLQIWNFDIVLPVNCFIGAFNYWSSLDFLDEVWLFNFWPLIQWDTKLHKILFRFFDILLCIWIFVFFSFISKLFK